MTRLTVVVSEVLDVVRVTTDVRVVPSRVELPEGTEEGRKSHFEDQKTYLCPGFKLSDT